MVGRYRLETSAGHAARSVVVHALQDLGWKPTKGERWDLCWSNELTDRERYLAATPAQVINHFRGIGSLTRKDRLAATIAAAETRLGRSLDLVPETYALPQGRAALLASDWPGPWIVKPRGGARGEDIWLAASAADVPLGQHVVVQRYVADPHLLDGFKYTLRWYVAITCADPLVVHVFDDGFTKLTSRPYRVDAASLSDRYIHLTNPDVQATNPEVAISERNLTRRAYRKRLTAEGHDAKALHRAARRAIVTCVLAAREHLVRSRLGEGRTMELLGFDVLIDAHLHPWVIEATLSPSITVEAAPTTRAAREEAELKGRMARDLLELVGVGHPWDGPPLRDVGGWRLAWPAPDAEDDLWSVLALPRPADAAAAGRAAPSVAVDPDTRWWDLGDGLAVLPAGRFETILLNPAASVALLGVAEGLGPAEIAAELVEAGVPTDEAATWDVLGDLVDQGALRRSDAEGATTPVPAPPAAVAAVAAVAAPRWNDEVRCSWGGRTVTVQIPGPEVGDVVRRALRRWLAEEGTGVSGLVEVLPTDTGWDVGGWRVRTPLELGPALRAAVISAAAHAGAGFVVRGTVVREAGATTLLLGSPRWRAERALAADAVLADDHAVPTMEGELIARPIGLLAPLPQSEWMEPLDPDAELSLDGQLVGCRVVAEPVAGPLEVDRLELEEPPEGPVGPSACLLALVDHGMGAIDAESGAALVALARRLGGA
jgi:hypothetical protein